MTVLEDLSGDLETLIYLGHGSRAGLVPQLGDPAVLTPASMERIFRTTGPARIRLYFCYQSTTSMRQRWRHATRGAEVYTSRTQVEIIQAAIDLLEDTSNLPCLAPRVRN